MIKVRASLGEPEMKACKHGKPCLPQRLPVPTAEARHALEQAMTSMLRLGSLLLPKNPTKTHVLNASQSPP